MTAGAGSIATVEDIGEERFYQEQTYDEHGRVFQKFDASGDYRGFRYHYDESGSISTIQEAREGVEGVNYFSVLSRDERGNADHILLGNGVEVFAFHDPQTGRLMEQYSYDSNGRELQELIYQYDQLGNLRSREDRSNGRELYEEFDYDDLNRLLNVHLTAPQDGIVNPLETLELQYDSIGKIRYKSDLGDYHYGENGESSHVLTSAGSHDFSYDGNGNQTQSSGGRNAEYGIINKLTRINGPAGETSFEYGLSDRRISRIDQTSMKLYSHTLYLDGVNRVEQGSEVYFERNVAGFSSGSLFSCLRSISDSIPRPGPSGLDSSYNSG